MSRTIPIGRLARLAGVGLLELRALARAGLLHPVRRDERGTIFYAENEVQRARLLFELLAAGASVKDLQALESIRSGAPSAGDASQSLVAMVDELVIRCTDRIERLRELREDLVRARETLHRCHACTHLSDTDHCRTCLTMPANPPQMLSAFFLADDDPDDA
jgi:DNA-binding transcriptional MerR regulator